MLRREFSAAGKLEGARSFQPTVCGCSWLGGGRHEGAATEDEPLADGASNRLNAPAIGLDTGHPRVVAAAGDGGGIDEVDLDVLVAPPDDLSKEVLHPGQGLRARAVQRVAVLV